MTQHEIRDEGDGFRRQAMNEAMEASKAYAKRCRNRDPGSGTVSARKSFAFRRRGIRPATEGTKMNDKRQPGVTRTFSFT